MSVHNKLYTGPDGELSPDHLESIGPLLETQVTITTALSKLMASKGDALPTPVAGWALIDTGASSTCVHEPVLRGLGLSPIGVASVGTAGGPVQQSRFAARIFFPAENFNVEFTSVISADLTGQTPPARVGAPAQPIIVLLGRDILRRCQFVYNGVGGFYTLSF